MSNRYALLVFALVLLITPAVATAQGNIASTGGGASQPVDAPDAINLLQWDDGSFETGLGVSGAAGYDGQIGMRFGGSPTTTSLVPMRLLGAYWAFYPGFAGATNVNINVWTNFGGLFPSNLATQVGGNTNTASTQYVGLPGSTISSASGSVLIGVGVLATGSWFLAADLGGSNQRQFFGAGSNDTTTWDYGPSTLTGYGFGINMIIRLVVDGNVPVELETYTVD